MANKGIRGRLEAMGIDLPADIKKKRPEELPMDLDMLRELLYSESAKQIFFDKVTNGGQGIRRPLEPAERAKRRAKDKVARKSRQANQRKRAVNRRRVEKHRKQRAA